MNHETQSPADFNIEDANPTANPTANPSIAPVLDARLSRCGLLRGTWARPVWARWPPPAWPMR